MLDVKTGRLSWGEGKALWPGMTHADFERSVLYQNELLNEAYKADRHNQLCNLKVQDIDGFPMAMKLSFDADDFLQHITLSQSSFYDWPEWPKTVSQYDYLLQIKNNNDSFIATQFQSQIEGGRELGFDFTWGNIISTFSFVHNPEAEIIISYFLSLIDPNFSPSNKPVYEMMGWTELDDEDDADDDEDDEEDDYYRETGYEPDQGDDPEDEES